MKFASFPPYGRLDKNFHTGATTFHSSYFGDGPNPHVISNIYCRGYESSLLSCDYNFHQAAQYCGDGRGAGAICLGQ